MNLLISFVVVEPGVHDIKMADKTDEHRKKVSKARELKLKKRNTRTAIEAQQMVLESADAIRPPSSQVPKHKLKAIDNTLIR